MQAEDCSSCRVFPAAIFRLESAVCTQSFEFPLDGFVQSASRASLELL